MRGGGGGWSRDRAMIERNLETERKKRGGREIEREKDAYTHIYFLSFLLGC